jgi:hypothetical protein
MSLKVNGFFSRRWTTAVEDAVLENGQEGKTIAGSRISFVDTVSACCADTTPKKRVLVPPAAVNIWGW